MGPTIKPPATPSNCSSVSAAVSVCGSSAFDDVSVGSHDQAHHDVAHRASVKVITHSETESRGSMEGKSTRASVTPVPVDAIVSQEEPSSRSLYVKRLPDNEESEFGNTCIGGGLTMKLCILFGVSVVLSLGLVLANPEPVCATQSGVVCSPSSRSHLWAARTWWRGVNANATTTASYSASGCGTVCRMTGEG